MFIQFITDYLAYLIALPVLVLLSAFYSGGETALFSLSHHHRLQLRRQDTLFARMTLRLLDDQRMFLVTLLFGNMLINTLYYAVSAAFIAQLAHDGYPKLILIAGGILDVLLLITFGEVCPKLIASIAPMALTRIVVLPIFSVHHLLTPIGLVISRFIILPLGRLIAPARQSSQITTDELEALLELSKHRGVIDRDEEQMLRQVVTLSQMKVRHIMVPRVDIKAINIDLPPAILRRRILEAGHPRLLAYQGSLDNILGVLYRRQYLLATATSQGPNIRKLIRTIRFIPELQRIDQLLEDFRKTGTQMAVAVDEYGGTAGLLTLKDIVEHMVGDLDMDQPSENPEDQQVRQIAPGTWRVSGKLSINDWADAFGQSSISPRISTVGGLVMANLGRLPRVGDRAVIGNLEIEIESLKARRIDGLILRLKHTIQQITPPGEQGPANPAKPQ